MMASKQKAARRRPFILGTAACHDFLIFSSILKMPFGAPTNMRLKVLGRQRRSSVLRRVRVRSAMAAISWSNGGPEGQNIAFYKTLAVRATPLDVQGISKPPLTSST